MQLHNGKPGGGGSSCNGGVIPSSSRTIERILDDAQSSGDLCISGRSMKEFPLHKHNLIDTSRADISRNRFVDIPGEICRLVFLELLNCRENLLRAIPQDFCRLNCLIELDLSRNNITSIPGVLCKLPLQILLISHNRLTVLPAEIGQMKSLRELDISCNEIGHLAGEICQIGTLRRLDVRKNHLTHLPSDLKKLFLVYLDVSDNCLANLPVSLSEMTSLQTLLLSGNPLQTPSPEICTRGKIHVFKSLERSVSRPKVLPTTAAVADPKEAGQRNGPTTTATSFQPPAGSTLPPTGLKQEALTERDAGVIYSVPQKLQRTIPFSPSCPLISKTLSLIPPLSVAPAFTEALSSSTSSPSSSGVVASSSTEGVSDEGVHSLTANGHSDPPADTLHSAKDASLRRASLTGSHLPKKVSPHQTASGIGKGTANTPLSSGLSLQGKMATKAAPTLHRRLSNGAGGPSSKDVSQSSTSSLTISASSDVPPNSARNISARSVHQKVSSVKKEISTNASKLPRISPSRSTPAARIASATDKTETAGKQESNPNFTIRRQQEQLREESEKLDMLKKYIEMRLKLTLPEDIMESLQDGVVLCHLVNNIRPRSVISIHVPPNTQTGILKLTPAKSRRNVENFLDAARRLGVPDGLICSSSDILEGKSPLRIYGCVNGLMTLSEAAGKRPAHGVPPMAQRSARTPVVRDSSVV